MKIELNTTEQFIKEVEYCYNRYMKATPSSALDCL